MKHATVQENPLGIEPITPLIIRYAIPSIISGLVGALYNVVDQIFIGQGVGILGNAATNVSFPLVSLSLAVSLLIGVGTAANYNLSLGAGRHEQAGRMVGNGVTLVIAVSVMMMIGIRTFLPQLLRAFGASEEIFPYAMDYASITSWGIPFLMASIALPAMIRSDGSPKYAMVCSLTGALLNTVLDPLFIFGLDMGIAGAAWATVISQGVNTALGLFYIFRRFQFVSLKRDYFVPKLSYAPHIFKLGISPLCNHLAMMLMLIVLNSTLASYGAESVYGSAIPLAAVGVISKVNVMYVSVVLGIAQGAQPIMGFNYGARQFQRVLEAEIKTVQGVTIVSFFALLIFQIFPLQIIHIFGEGGAAYDAFAVRYFRIFMAMTLFNGLQPAASFLFTAVGKPWKGLMISLTRQILFLIPLIIIFARWFGIHGVMYAGPIADAASALIAFTLLRGEIKQMRGNIQ